MLRHMIIVASSCRACLFFLLCLFVFVAFLLSCEHIVFSIIVIGAITAIVAIIAMIAIIAIISIIVIAVIE